MTTNNGTFDASKYLTKVQGGDYLEVKFRLLWLRHEHPDASIDTELVEHIPGQLAVFRARVSIPGTGSATGWGSERADSFPDYIEKGETRALGRALAALGFGTQFCEDYYEAGHVADSPMQRGGKRGVQRAPTNGIAATRAQLKALKSMATDFGLDNSALDAKAREVSGVNVADLSKRQASQMISSLSNLRR